MNVRAHMSMLFHLDKCIGCHTCSIACKNVWTDRKGAEYMWWNNVETRPGTGYPTLWENQKHYRGGWQRHPGRKHGSARLQLRLQSRSAGMMRLFYNPALPALEDYYEPFTYRYADLFNAPAGDDQPTAIPISQITGRPIEIQAGPNWDDDLGGSNIYARNDVNLEGLPENVRQAMGQVERIVFNYLPRICNHCLNPACVAACPSGAIYKRAEDGVVLVNENRCRAWRMCVAACPYKKVYYNWGTGKSEKCILCFPRLETGQASACAHSCVGRIRYMGVLLYDADAIPTTAALPDDKLVEGYRDLILDPFDPEVLAAARANGIEESWLAAAQKSPVYKFIRVWKLALPLHPEFRTIPMMYYIPPLSPVVSVVENGLVKLDLTADDYDFEVLARLEATRMPLQYLANLLAAGNENAIRSILAKMLAVRTYKRRMSVNGEVGGFTLSLLARAKTTPEEAEAIYRMTTLPTLAERFVIPQYHRETAVEAWQDPLAHKGDTGFGYVSAPQRGE